MYSTTSIIILILFVITQNSVAQLDTTTAGQNRNFIRSFGFGIQHGFIFAHSQAVQNTKGSNPTGIEFNISWQRNDRTVWELCNCFPRKGLLLAVYSYDNTILGQGYMAAYFLEPSYKIGKNAFFSLRAAFGGAFLSNPYDSIKNPTNMSYSTNLNAYLLVGLGAWIKMGTKWWLNPSINYQHVSNGGGRQPNKGVNWPTVGIAVNYQQNPSGYFTGTRTKEKFWRSNPARFDIGVFANLKRSVDKVGDSKRVPLIGLALGVAKQVGRINNLTATAEVYWDRSLELQLKRDTLSASAVRSGISIGHEFILGKFLFHQRLGIYIFDQTPYNDLLFHRWGLLFHLKPSWGLGFSFQAHRHIADFIDFRLVRSIQVK